MELKIDNDDALLKYVEFYSKTLDAGDYIGICLCASPKNFRFGGKFIVAPFARTMEMDTLSTYEGRYYYDLREAQDRFEKEVENLGNKGYKIHQKSF